MSDHLGIEEIGIEEWTVAASGFWVYFMRDKNILKLDYGSSCTALSAYKKPLNCILKMNCRCEFHCNKALFKYKKTIISRSRAAYIMGQKKYIFLWGGPLSDTEDAEMMTS